MKNSRWRETSAKIIRTVINTNPGANEKELRKALKDQYPFGARKWHPYKIWCDEVNRQLGKKKKVKGTKIENQLTLL